MDEAIDRSIFIAKTLPLLGPCLCGRGIVRLDIPLHMGFPLSTSIHSLQHQLLILLQHPPVPLQRSDLSAPDVCRQPPDRKPVSWLNIARTGIS